MQLFYPGEESVLRPELVTAWKKRRNSYNFTSLPASALISIDHSIIRHLDTFRARPVKGIKGRHFVRKDLLFCSEFGNGAAALISLLEELRALGVQRFVFLGSAGILSDQYHESDIVAVRQAVSGVGVSMYYTDNHLVDVPDLDFYMKLQQATGAIPGNCFSVDTPFRETRSLLNEAIRLGAQLVEMECAALYAFAGFYRLPAVCFLVAADNLAAEWTAPVNFDKLVARQKQLLDQLVKNCS